MKVLLDFNSVFMQVLQIYRLLSLSQALINLFQGSGDVADSSFDLAAARVAVAAG